MTAATSSDGDASNASVVPVMATDSGVETIKNRTSMSEARESITLGPVGRF